MEGNGAQTTTDNEVSRAPTDHEVSRAPSARSPASPGGTALALDVPRGPAPPFGGGAPEPSRVGATTERAHAPSTRSPLAGTAIALDLPRGPALPFAAEPAPSSRAIASVPVGPTSTRAPASLGETALALDAPRAPELPFERPIDAPPPSHLRGTAPALDRPLTPALPFDRDAAPSPHIASPSPVAPTSTRPAGLGGTAPAMEVPRAPDLPFDTAAKPKPKRNKLAEVSFALAVPRELLSPKPAAAKAPDPAVHAEVGPVSLTLEQHASLCAELAIAPDQEDAVLLRYRLTRERKAAVDQHYREKVGASADLRTAWNQAYRVYAEWLVSARGETPR